MRVLWMEIRYYQSPARLVHRNWVNKGGLDLSKKVLWVSVGQMAAELQAVKVKGHEKILPISQVRTCFARARLISRIFFKPLTLMTGISDALWPTETHSTSLERSKTLLLTQFLFKSLERLQRSTPINQFSKVLVWWTLLYWCIGAELRLFKAFM